MSIDMDPLPVDFPTPIAPPVHGNRPWEFYSGPESCFENDCEERWPCSHVTAEFATFGDVYVRDGLERLLFDLRVQMLRGASGDDLLDRLDSGVTALAEGFAENIDSLHGDRHALAKRRLFKAVADGEKLVAEVDAIIAQVTGAADHG